MPSCWSHSALTALLFGCIILPLAACASADASKTTAAKAEDDENNDPYEGVNRKIWAVDLTLDRFLLKPIAKTYRDVAPQVMQTALSNVLNNLKNPVIMANDLLQGNTERAGDTFSRLAMNTVFGLGGLIDVGTASHIPAHNADFGQTLGVWGVSSGPYLVLPLLGPSDPRDGLGYGIDSFADPYSIEMRAHSMDEADYLRSGLGIISSRAQTIDELDELQRSSLDFYAAVRSLYQQQRDAAVAEGKNPNGAASASPNVRYDEDSTSPTPSVGPGKAK